MLYAFLLIAGASVGFLSGLLGIGGGIIMFPVLYYLPPVLGLDSVAINNITGLTMIQGFTASLVAVFFHRKLGFVSAPLVITLGVSLFVSSLSGALVSKAAPEEVLLAVFAVLAVAASFMMLMPRSYTGDDVRGEDVTFSRPAAVVIGLVLGFFLGLVGQGGAFIVIPIMLYVLKIPLRVALGSMLAVGLFSSTAGLAGKVATGQVPFVMAAMLLAGVIPMAAAGSYVSKRTSTRTLKWILAVIIAASAIKILLDIL